MAHSWADFLRGPAPSAHAAQVYVHVDELAASVAAYLTAGFEAGEPALVVATPQHLALFAERLAAAGWTSHRVEAEGLLAVADADATLASIMNGSRPDPDAFERVVGRLIDRFEGRHVRAFGEMVDLLSERGEREAASALEELWNMLARTRRFSLLCGYRLDVFDAKTQARTLPAVCRAHSHVLPVAEPARLAEAVDLALEEVLGRAQAQDVRAVVHRHIRRDRVPSAQLVLMWVAENMPAVADRILVAARGRYAGHAAAV